MSRINVENAGYKVNWAEPLGRGRTATAYEAIEEATGRPVVVKESAIPAFSKIEAEVMHASSRASPYLPDLFFDSSEGNLSHLVMERCGAPIVDTFKLAKPEGQIVQIHMNDLRAVRALHEAGYLHLDGHPLNIRIEGTDPRSVRRLDFGAAVRMQNGTAQSYRFHGRWRAPEQLGASGMGEVGPWTDLYSVGLMLGASIQGYNPIRVPVAKMQDFPFRAEAARNPDLSGVKNSDLQGVVRKAISAAPARRYQSADEFLNALRPFSGPET